MQAIITRMVQDRVDEIMAERGGSQLEPGFQPKEVAYELQRRQTVFERRKWALYFLRWGCRMCNRKKNVSHASGGCCATCITRVGARLETIKLQYERDNPEAAIDRQIDRLTSRFRSAEALLGEGEE
jgi:hypothetical protein